MPMNRANYPPNWRQISLNIRTRAGWRCEGSAAYPDCRAIDGARHPVTGSKVALTVAHMGLPMFLPFHLHVTGATKANEVINLVGFGMALNPEVPEWNNVMNHRSLSEFVRGSTAESTPFIVALPHSPSSVSPGRPVVLPSTTSPIWVLLTSFRLSREPLEAAGVTTKTPTSTKVIARDMITLPAHLAYTSPQPALGAAELDVPALVRTGFSLIGGLGNSQGEHLPANLAGFFYFAATGRSPNARELLPQSPHATQLAEADFRARFSESVVRCGCREHLPADYTDLFGGAESWSSHTLSIPYHVIQNTFNNDPANLRAMCQRCHLTYDAAHHAANAARTRAERRRGDCLPLPMETNQ